MIRHLVTWPLQLGYDGVKGCSDLRQCCSLIEQSSVNMSNPVNIPDNGIEVPITPITPKPASLMGTICNVLTSGKCKLDQHSPEALTGTSPTCSKHTIRLPPQKKASKGSLTQQLPLESSPSLYSSSFAASSSSVYSSSNPYTDEHRPFSATENPFSTSLT